MVTLRPSAHTPDHPPQLPVALTIGLDVGSTTVKAVVIDPATDAILWKDYQRHETRQPEKVLEFLQRIERDFPIPIDRFRIFITGSGGAALAEYIGARFVQEVNAVSLAVERFHPDAGSVIELGGQDAKIIIWVEDPITGQKRKLPSMNDKCAGGTGAVIDKINAKLGLDSETLKALPYYDVKLHAVAGKCGVFAETDINGLQKQGVPANELMASLFEALVQQNLSVLTRGNTLRPKVLLLGGPNTFLPALQDAWRHHIPSIWEERAVALPEGVDPKDLIIVPQDAQYFAAVGSVLFGKEEDEHIGRYTGTAALVEYAEHGRKKMREASGAPGLLRSAEEMDGFARRYTIPPFTPATFRPGQVVEAYAGIDGGSTSTKAVLMDAEGNLLVKAYRLSQGNPIEDTQDILADLRRAVEDQGATLHIKGMGTTGYAKDMLKDTIGADVAIVETVAHTMSALHYYKDVDVIVDVGGQDIKVIILHDGKVKDFRLNTQCSAGNGYFLQSTASRFGFKVTDYADAAFQAERVPLFSYGCAVFMESDIVNFQQLGWSREEIMGGLAAVLPKNIWLYVVQEPNLGKLGRRFVLQGGTQHNLAAVKAQVDFITSKVPDVEIFVHQHCGESGAIGAALEAIRVVRERESGFIGFQAAESLQYTATRSEETRCYFCKNRCLRTFIDTTTPQGDSRRFIIATCEKGAVEALDDMKVIKARIEEIKKANPNFVEIAANDAFKPQNAARAPRPQPPLMARLNPRKRAAWESERARWEERRANMVIGMPRVLNMYTYAPFFTAYFESLGVPWRQIIFSPPTDEAMWKEGSRRGSIDQCFPSKVALAHVHALLYNAKQKPDIIFFPVMNTLLTELEHVVDSCACPTVSATPEVTKAAFTKEDDAFAANGCVYHDPAFNMAEPELFERQMLEWAAPIFGVTPEENRSALQEAYKALKRFKESLRTKARAVLEQLEREHRVGVVMLGRPYHNDPGLNHEIVEAIQKLGFPIFSIDALPSDPDILERLFGEEVHRGEIKSPMDITDVWKNAYSENSSRKAWGAKYVARHPNLVALDLSSFKCGHDAPMYSMIEEIVESSRTPYFTFHDIDENKPAGAIKIRVETIAYFLGRYQDDLREKAETEARIRAAVRAYEEALRRGESPPPPRIEQPKPGVVIPLGISLNSSLRGRGCDSGGCGSGHDDHAEEVDACGAGGCGDSCSCGPVGAGPAMPLGRFAIDKDLMLPVLSLPARPGIPGGVSGERDREMLALPVLN
jgi:predicted CoA-substrate-specific enzyme activase